MHSTETEEKEVLVRPDWMDKPKEDMSEEERRLVKEFDKKMAIFKVWRAKKEIIPILNLAIGRARKVS